MVRLSTLLTPRQGWRLVMVIAILWGSLLRFYDLGAKVYWEDETFSSLRVAGYTIQEISETSFTGDVIYPADLLQFQTVNEQKNLVDTIASLAEDVHPPLYFALLRIWVNYFGSSPQAMRSLSVVVGLLLLPSVYGLAMVLFERWPQRQEIAGLATALVAVSPYQIKLATEARMYSLLQVLIILAGICLLQAVKSVPVRSHSPNRSRLNYWRLYGLIGAASLYVHWLAVPMLFGNGLYVWIQHYKTRSLTWALALKQYLRATALTIGAIVPWVLFVGFRLRYVYSQTRWTAESLNLIGEKSLISRWFKNGLMLFFNGELFSQWPFLLWLGGLFAVGCIGWTIVFLIRHTPLSIWSFLLIASSIIYGPLALADLTLGGRRSTIFRYMGTSVMSIEITVAFCLVSLSGISGIVLASYNTGPKRSPQKRNMQGSYVLARWAIVSFLIGGALSQTMVAVAFSSEQQPLGQVAKIVNHTPHALLVSDAPRPSLIMPLAHLLNADIPLQLTIRPQIPTLENVDNHAVFLYLSSEKLQAALKSQGHQIEQVPGVDNFLRLSAVPPASHNLMPVTNRVRH